MLRSMQKNNVLYCFLLLQTNQLKRTARRVLAHCAIHPLNGGMGVDGPTTFVNDCKPELFDPVCVQQGNR